MLTYEAVSRLSDWANITLIVSLVFGVVATYCISWTGSIKEEYLKRELAEATVNAEKAKADAAKATENAALANLELEKIKAPRQLVGQQVVEIGVRMRPYAGQKFTGLVTRHVADARNLWRSIYAALFEADWIGVNPNGEQYQHREMWPGEPISSDVGVTIYTQPNASKKSIGAAQMLAEHLSDKNILARAKATAIGGVDPSIITIEIGSKPFLP